MALPLIAGCSALSSFLDGNPDEVTVFNNTDSTICADHSASSGDLRDLLDDGEDCEDTDAATTTDEETTDGDGPDVDQLLDGLR